MKINPASSANNAPLIQAISQKKVNSLRTKSFVYSRLSIAKKVPKSQKRYKNVSIKGTEKRYIEYYFRIPPDFPALLWKKEWVGPNGELKLWARFRVFDGLNKTRSAAQWMTAEEVLQSVIDSLKDGYDPFKEMTEELNRLLEEQRKDEEEKPPPVPSLTLSAAVEKFLNTYRPNSSTQKSHQVTKSFLMDYFGDQYNSSLSSIRGADLLEMLDEYNVSEEWKAGTYNDKVGKLKTMFGYFHRIELIEKNISLVLQKKKKAAKTKHTPFTDEVAALVKKKLLRHPSPMGKLTHDFCMTLYYTATRPNKETRVLKCGDILWERDQILIDRDRAKGQAGGYIALDPELKKLFISMGVKDAPPDFYIFGTDYKPGIRCFSPGTFMEFFRVNVREPNGLSEDYTLYSWKHTRVCHLYIDGVSIRVIQRFCRHSSPTMTENYLKDLGLMEDNGVNQKTRKF